MSTNKAWFKTRSKLYGKRLYEVRDEKPRFLIVCEGAKTEPLYFEGFRISSVKVEIFKGAGMHMSVVERAKQLNDEYAPYDYTWCVFDKDKNLKDPEHDAKFNAAIFSALAQGFKVAYSVDAFELWYLLHFQFFDTAISRSDYVKKLKSLVPGGYTKNRIDMYEILEPMMDVAIKNAKKLYAKNHIENPAKADPSTTIYQLVEELRKLAK